MDLADSRTLLLASLGAPVTMAVVHAHPTVAKLHRLVGLSEGMPKDGAFARQAKRKFC